MATDTQWCMHMPGAGNDARHALVHRGRAHHAQRHHSMPFCPQCVGVGPSDILLCERTLALVPASGVDPPANAASTRQPLDALLLPHAAPRAPDSPSIFCLLVCFCVLEHWWPHTNLTQALIDGFGSRLLLFPILSMLYI